ncbi:MAG: YidC/Oxa1 family membrane protein insertase [Microthrixaceae bacterium]
MFEPLFDALASVMNFFYSLVPSYGLAIMGLTVVVMVVITPLTVKSTRSMLEMQRLQPEMKRIQEKYKNDREKLNAELMAFYKEHKINPLGGCLPLIAQMPVFIIMYQLMRGLTVRAGGLGSGIGQIGGETMTGKALTPWVMTDQVFQPSHLNPGSDMYEALTRTNDMNFFGMDLSLSASEALQMSLLIALPFLALLLIMLVTGIVQNRQLQARNANASANPQQQMIMKFMPFFLPVISFGFPAGLALYWTTQNLCRIGTNHYITRSIYAKHRNEEPIEARSTEKKGKGAKGDKGAKGSGDGKGSGNDKGSGNGSSARKSDRSTKTSSGTKGSSKADKNGGSAPERAPGKSVKSQKAHEKSASGRGSGSSKKATGQRRRSGERRR